MKKPDFKMPSRLDRLSYFRIIAQVALVIGGIELIVMTAFEQLPFLPHWIEVLIDCLAMIIVSAVGIARLKIRATLIEATSLNDTIVHSMSEGLVLQDASGKIISANPAACLILGLTSEQLFGRQSIDSRWRAVRENGEEFPGDQHPAMVALRTGIPQYNVIMGVHQPSGSKKWIRINAVPIHTARDAAPDAPRDTPAVVVTFADVTEQFIYQTKTEDANFRLSVAIEAVRFGVWDWNLKTGTLVWDHFMYTLFDIDKADFSGDYDAFEKTLLPEDSKRVGEELQAVFKARGDRYESTFRVKGQQGKIKHIKVSARCFYDSDGKIDKLIGNNWDVSNDVERTHALESSQEMLRKIIDSTPDWIFVKDIEHRYLLANRAFGEAIKMDASEFLGKNDLEIGFPEDIVKGNPETGIPGFWADDKKVFETGELIVVEDDPALVNGVMRKFHTIKAPLFDEKNQVYAVLGYSRDLTEEREKDALLEKQRASLVESTKMASLGEMSAGIAHEINNPLAVISGFARRIERTLTELPESASRAGIQDAAMRIQQHTKRIAAIVKGLRAFARDTTHDPFVNIGIRSVIEDSLGLCQEKFKVMGIDLRLVLPQVELVVSGRPAELSQVVVNLLNNARDAIAGCEQPWVQVEVQARGQDKVAVLISDSGPGVPEALQDKIMQPFFTTKPVGSGTGLGLSISHGIITSHGGTLTLARRLSASTFEIVLPAVASAAVASTEQTPHGPASPGRSEAA